MCMSTYHVFLWAVTQVVDEPSHCIYIYTYTAMNMALGGQVAKPTVTLKYIMLPVTTPYI